MALFFDIVGNISKDNEDQFELLLSQLALPSSVNENYLEFVRQRYKEENGRPGSQDTRVSIYLGILAIIVTGLSIFYNKPPMGDSLLHWFLYLLLTISIGFLFYSVMNLWSYFRGHEYSYPPLEVDALDAALLLQSTIKAIFGNKLAHLADEKTMHKRAFNLYLAKAFANCSESDRQINDEKSRILVVIGRSIIGIILLISIALVINFIIQ